MKIFAIDTKESLARLLAVGSFEIDQTLADRAKHYRSFRRVKPNGTYRVLYNPRNPLRLLQQKVKSHILDKVSLPKCVHGGVRGCSVVTNARPHVNKEIVFTLDLKDFYPSVRPRAVYAIFTALGFGPEAARVLTEITTWDNHVPQGVVTSTALANWP